MGLKESALAIYHEHEEAVRKEDEAAAQNYRNHVTDKARAAIVYHALGDLAENYSREDFDVISAEAESVNRGQVDIRVDGVAFRYTHDERYHGSGTKLHALGPCTICQELTTVGKDIRFPHDLGQALFAEPGLCQKCKLAVAFKEMKTAPTQLVLESAQRDKPIFPPVIPNAAQALAGLIHQLVEDAVDERFEAATRQRG